MLTFLQRMIDGLSAALMIALTALAFFQVLARYALGISTPWSEELLRLLFVWLVLLGASRAVHMRVDLLDGMVGQTGRVVLAVLNAVIGGALLILLMVHGWTLIELTTYDRYTALPLSVQWLYWSLIVGCGLWLVFLAIDFARKLRSSA